MRKILFFIMSGLLPLGMAAQTESPKQLGEAIIDLSVKIVENDDSLAKLERSVTLLSKREKIKLKSNNFTEVMKKYKSLRDLYEDSIRVKKIGKKYIPMIEMYKAYEDGCTQAEYRAIIVKLESMKLPEYSTEADAQEFAAFKKDYEKIAYVFDDYEYTMKELARVFKVVEKKESGDAKAILKALEADDETYYIDKIPYAQRLLKKFIDSKKEKCLGIDNKKEYPRAEIVRKLAEAWSEAGFTVNTK